MKIMVNQKTAGRPNIDPTARRIYVAIAMDGRRGAATVYTPGAPPYVRAWKSTTLQDLSNSALCAAVRLVDRKGWHSAVILTDVCSSVRDGRICQVPRTVNWFANQMAQDYLDQNARE